jgi:hypothetical protein
VLEEDGTEWVLDVTVDRVEQAPGFAARSLDVREAQRQDLVDRVSPRPHTAGHDDHGDGLPDPSTCAGNEAQRSHQAPR